MVEHVSWQLILSRLSSQRSYWLSTVAGDGSPHVAPIWGAVTEDAFYFYTERSTVKARNLAKDSRVALHPADAEEVVIVHGLARDLGYPGTRPEVVAAFSAKYTRPGDAAFLPMADPSFDVLYLLVPDRAMLWQLDDYEGAQQRWRSDSS
ncbi:pyridoxamine 5'-phosphate oxidase family protein [Jatrophihabitans sp. DSM 45814]